MNTRPESITGVDLIKYQIKVANDEKLDLEQKDLHLKGHAIECRINAEDPEKDFNPSPGKITQLMLPGGPGVRIDSGVYPGSTIPPFYVSMVAKLITWGTDRREAVERMKRALLEFYMEGIQTTIPFHKKVMKNKEFLRGQYTTDFVSEFM